ncbi:MAG: hypothetical protein ACK47B_06575 [Armatimonadota bacterium]
MNELREKKSARRLRVLTIGIALSLVVGLLYAGAAAVVFDFSQPAASLRQQTDELGRPVALGPGPRLIPEERDGWSYGYTGREWPFVFFSPICRVWVAANGFQPPSWDPRAPLRVEAVGACKLWKWVERDRPNGALATLEIRDPRGRTAARISDFDVSVEWTGDLTQDGLPEVILCQWNGGNNIWANYYVYSLGPKPACLLAYGARRITGLEPKDVDSDDALELLADYDGFAGWKNATVGGPFIPMVLGWRGGRFVEAGAVYPAYLRAEQRAAKDWLRSEQREAEWGLEAPVIQLYALTSLLAGPAEARKQTLGLLTPAERQGLDLDFAVVEDGLRARKGRFRYPKAYDLRRVQWEIWEPPQ